MCISSGGLSRHFVRGLDMQGFHWGREKKEAERAFGPHEGLTPVGIKLGKRRIS